MLKSQEGLVPRYSWLTNKIIYEKNNTFVLAHEFSHYLQRYNITQLGTNLMPILLFINTILLFNSFNLSFILSFIALTIANMIMSAFNEFQTDLLALEVIDYSLNPKDLKLMKDQIKNPVQSFYHPISSLRVSYLSNKEVRDELSKLNPIQFFYRNLQEYISGIQFKTKEIL